ncbi:MAG: flagellin [Pseudomonadota bacterium]
MGFSITDKSGSSKLNRILRKHQESQSDSLEKLSTGQVFTSLDPKPSERALAEKMEFRLRSLAASKKNVNDAISLVETADSSMSEISNTVTRMKEINMSAASTTLSNQERRYLFVEYQALYDELDRMSVATTFNGIPILNGSSEEVPDELVFRVDDPLASSDGNEESDINTIRFAGIKDVDTRPESLGLKSASALLSQTTGADGIGFEEVQDFITSNTEGFQSVYEEALTKLSEQRSVFGALQTRLQKTLDFNDVYSENIAAAKSKVADTDYASEVSRLVTSQIATQATTSLLSQSNMEVSLAWNLIKGAL